MSPESSGDACGQVSGLMGRAPQLRFGVDVGPRVGAERGRAHLLAGEWLRRRRRRLDARDQLRTPPRDVHWDGVEAFAGRAERELLATGERGRKRTVETREHLTAQEAQTTRLAGAGFSSAQIGARLFPSPKTVE